MRVYDKKSRTYWRELLEKNASSFDFQKETAEIIESRYQDAIREVRAEKKATEKDDRERERDGPRRDLRPGRDRDRRDGPLRDPRDTRRDQGRRDLGPDRRNSPDPRPQRERPTPVKAPCRNWAKDGKCDWGDKCKFAHGNEPAAKVEPGSRVKEDGHDRDRRDRSRDRR